MAQEVDTEQALAVLEAYNRQVDALVRQLSFLQSIQEETQRARLSLEGLQKEPSSELLVPLGAGTFIHAEARKKGTVLSGIGAGYSLEKPVADALQALVGREEEVKAEMQTVSERVVRLQQEAAALQDQLRDALEGGPQR